uniref:Protein FAR1-RELATED SEQUENCE n=1 Tax=Cucumis melo TaxID=3656 RepID=A0A9I9EF13_CUCME
MDGVSLNTEPVGEEEGDYFEIEGDSEIADYVDQNGIFEGENPLPPAVGMEFESYEDVYYFYSCYAKEQGFGVRVSNTWYRKSKEKYRGKLSCSSAGFKKKSEANRPRPETRTGCPAMIKFRLMDTRRWRIIEVELDHNHLINPTSGKFYKSHKNLGVGTKRLLQLDSVEVQKVRLFQTVYDQAIQSHHQLEVLADEDSKNSSFMLKSRCYFEAQLCKLYTNGILEKFEKEVEGMYCCFNTRKLNAEAPLMTYIVKEHVEMEGSRRDAREFEVSYNESDMEVQCNCGLFNSKGYLCRHALSVLTQNGIEEIPAQYILPRWRKDVKRNYILDYSYTTSIDTNSQIHRYDHIYRSIVQVIEEGRKSKEKYSIAVQGIKDILSKLRLGNDTSS